jgi:hypothetical protein
MQSHLAAGASPSCCAAHANLSQPLPTCGAATYHQDVRIKPDIIAPGMTRSAKSSGDYEGKMDSCSTEWSQGGYLGASGFGP